MKVIDLLNKIANGEEVPERIKVDNIIYRYEDWERFYYTDNESREDLLVKGKDYSTNNFLNWDVELIEENQSIDIQSIKEWETKSTINDLHDVENEIRFLWMGYNNLLKIGKQLDRQINNN